MRQNRRKIAERSDKYFCTEKSPYLKIKSKMMASTAPMVVIASTAITSVVSSICQGMTDSVQMFSYGHLEDMKATSRHVHVYMQWFLWMPQAHRNCIGWAIRPVIGFSVPPTRFLFVMKWMYYRLRKIVSSYALDNWVLNTCNIFLRRVCEHVTSHGSTNLFLTANRCAPPQQNHGEREQHHLLTHYMERKRDVRWRGA